MKREVYSPHSVYTQSCAARQALATKVGFEAETFGQDRVREEGYKRDTREGKGKREKGKGKRRAKLTGMVKGKELGRGKAILPYCGGGEG